jgi:hypothetical protein
MAIGVGRKAISSSYPPIIRIVYQPLKCGLGIKKVQDESHQKSCHLNKKINHPGNKEKRIY